MDVETNIDKTEESEEQQEIPNIEESSTDSITVIPAILETSEQVATEDTAGQYQVEKKRNKKKKKKKKKHSSHGTEKCGEETAETGAPVDLTGYKTAFLQQMDPTTSTYSGPAEDGYSEFAQDGYNVDERYNGPAEGGYSDHGDERYSDHGDERYSDHGDERYSEPIEAIPILDEGMEIVIKKRRKRRRTNSCEESIPEPPPPEEMLAQQISTDEISVTICQGNKTDKRKRKRRSRKGEDGGVGEEYSPVDLSSHKAGGYINPSTSKQNVVSEEDLFTGQYTKELYRKILAAEVEALKNESQEEQDEQDENMFEKDEKLPCLDQYLNTSLEEGDPFVPAFTGDPICPYCNKIFSKPAHRNHHVKAVHLKIKPYKCSVCGKAFSEKQTLKVHGFLHTDEKRFECHLCDTSFRNVSNLYQHQKTHINNTMDLELKPSKKKKFNPKFPENYLQIRLQEDDVVARPTETVENVEASYSHADVMEVMSKVSAARGVIGNEGVRGVMSAEAVREVMSKMEAVREM